MDFVVNQSPDLGSVVIKMMASQACRWNEVSWA